MLPAFLPVLAPLISELAPKLARAVTGSERAETAAAAIVPAIAAAAGFPVRTAEDAARAVAAIHGDSQRYADASASLRGLEQAYLADLQNARARDLEVRKMTGGENRRANALLLAVVVLLVACLGAMVAIGVFVEVETPHLATATGLLGTAAGFLLRGLSSALDFEFGSSRGSKDKSAEIAAMRSPEIGFPPSPRPAPMAPVVEPGDRPRGLR